MSIRKSVTSKGKERFAVYVNDTVTRRQIYIGTFDRRSDAEEAEYEAKRRLRLGERPTVREEVKFKELSRRWQEGLVSVRPSTRRDYDKAVRRLLPALGDMYVSAIRRKDVDDLIVRLAKQYSASTVRKTIVILKMILRMAVEHDLLDTMPTGSTRLSLPRQPRRTFEPLTSQQVRDLIEATTPDYRPFIQLLLTSGLRGAEARGLRLADVDLDAGVVRVRGQLVNRKIEPLKSEASRRDVSVPRQTVDSLREHISQVPTSELGLLFPTPEGQPITASNFYRRVWIPARTKAGLPEMRLHDCRHHVASVYLAQGRSITYVQRLLGHSSPSTLLSVYAWVTRQEAEIATVEFERWLVKETPAARGHSSMGLVLAGRSICAEERSRVSPASYNDDSP